MRYLWAGFVSLLAALPAGWGAYRLYPRTLEFLKLAPILTWEHGARGEAVRLPGRFLTAQVALHDDELYAYLIFQHLRGAPELSRCEVLLTYKKSGGALVYPIEVRLPDDLLTAIPLLQRAQERGLIQTQAWRYVDRATLDAFRYQTHVFRTAYNLRSGRSIEEMSRAELAGYIRRFVRYKSSVDPRIRARMEPAPRPLSNQEAHRMAEDIVTVADFYAIPLDFFIGIGAIENNYMNVMGDLEHAVWKRRAEPGDVVLKRGRRGVLIRNPALGPWQITRETLRRVHKFYLADERDYSLLPEHLRPPAELNLDEVRPEALTTYAGLYFRQLLDRFEGDVRTAVGAYNGGPGNPNPEYEAGVRVAAEHARRMIRQAAALHGKPAAGMTFLRAGPP